MSTNQKQVKYSKEEGIKQFRKKHGLKDTKSYKEYVKEANERSKLKI